MRKACAVMLLTLVMSLSLHARAEAPAAHGSDVEAPAAAAALDLPAPLRDALIAEMAGLRQRIAELAAQLATAEWTQAADNAAKVRDSYIMKQALSDAQRRELADLLPAPFLALDARFHHHAEGLAGAAEAHDSELALFYFDKMLEGCQLCHSRYATKRFPGFVTRGGDVHRH